MSGEENKTQDKIKGPSAKLLKQHERAASLDRSTKRFEQAKMDYYTQQVKRRKEDPDHDDEEDTYSNGAINMQILNAIQEMNNTIQEAVLNNISLLTQQQLEVKQKQEQFDKALVSQNEEIEELKQENQQLKYRVGLSEARVERLEETVFSLKEEMLQMQSRSMRNNLVFQNIKEDNNERPEATKTKIDEFLTKNMKVKDTNKVIQIDRVHRMGQKYPGKDRPIVCHFVNSDGKELVQRNGSNLKDTSFYVNEQFPQEIEERRRKARQQIKTIKEKDPSAKCSVRYDKLFVNGQAVAVEEKPRFVFNDSDIQRSQGIDLAAAETVTVEGSTFQGYAAKIKSPNDVKATILKMFDTNKLTSKATHLVYAYRVRTNNKMCENYADDGQPGAGKTIFNALQGRNTEGVVVIVACWYGGKHLGNDRWPNYKKCAQAALEKLIA